MVIDKTTPFYTEQDNAALSEYSKRLDACILQNKELAADYKKAQAAGNEAFMREIEEHLNEVDALYILLMKDIEGMRAAVERRYIEAFNGDTDAILNDVKDIVDAVEKEEYTTSQALITRRIKPILDDITDKRARKSMKDMTVRGYVNCYSFILRRIRVQLNALHYYGDEEGRDQAIQYVEDKAASFYTRPKAAKLKKDPTEIQSRQIIEQEEYKELLTMPSSPAINSLLEVLGNNDLSLLKDRKKQFNRNVKFNVFEDGSSRRITYDTTGKSKTIIEISDFQKVANAQTKKLLIRILLHSTEQAVHNGELTRKNVSFPLRELVGEGQYKNLDTARQGFWNSIKILMGISVGGEVYKGNNIIKQEAAVMFPFAIVDNGTCTIDLNPRINWNFVATFYTALPEYYVELPDRAAELLEYIFYLARNNSDDIGKKGFFTISYRAIQARLNLPDENTNKNPKRDIKDAIDQAIEQIEEKYKDKRNEHAPNAKTTDEPDFYLIPREDYDAPIKKYLDEGVLEVHLKGDYAARFIKVNQKAAAKIERQERIEEEAQTRALSKKISAKKTKSKK